MLDAAILREVSLDHQTALDEPEELSLAEEIRRKRRGWVRKYGRTTD